MDLKYNVLELMIHKKDKTLIQIELSILNERPALVVHETVDGINLGKEITQSYYMLSLPELTGNILLDLKAVLNHFRSHGFISVNTITSTSKGIKFS